MNIGKHALIKVDYEPIVFNKIKAYDDAGTFLLEEFELDIFGAEFRNLLIDNGCHFYRGDPYVDFCYFDIYHVSSLIAKMLCIKYQDYIFSASIKKNKKGYLPIIEFSIINNTKNQKEQQHGNRNTNNKVLKNR